jgi:hypothetical protein
MTTPCNRAGAMGSELKEVGASEYKTRSQY